ncbi:MAG TPA: amidohydrolase family protein [Phycisphaerae bacterium]|nr:amidohydrolase family protein [Phycisphaerae bacterium]
MGRKRYWRMAMATAARGRWGALLVSLGLAVVAVAQPPAVPPEKVALTGGRIIPVVGSELAKGTILIEQGRIVAVGADVEIPYDARVVNVTGKVVFPGMIDVHTARGLDVANEPRPVTPQLDVGDALDPSQLFFEDCLRLGTTAVHVIPGNNTVIGGVGRVVRPIGLTIAEMTIAAGEFLKISLSPRSGYDRMMQLATLRETFLELDDYLARLAEKRYEDKLKEDDKKLDVGPVEARKRGRELIRAEDVDDQHRNILRLLGGQVRFGGESGATLYKPLGAYAYCGEAMDVGAAVRLAKENGFFERLVLVLGGECHKAVGELKRAARPVVLPPELTWRETDPLTGEIRETFVPKKLFDAGLLWALVPGPDDSYAERMLTYQAAQCVRHGIPRDEALKAITLNPARMLRLDSRLGSIEVGKDANLVVFSGDPLDFDSVVEQVFIEGIRAYDRGQDVRLKKLLAPGTSDSQEKPE